jgi:hypothetical protein
MGRRAYLLIAAASALALAVGAAGLVSAQQGEPAAAVSAAKPASAVKPAPLATPTTSPADADSPIAGVAQAPGAPAPAEPTIQPAAPVEEASDDTPDAPPSAALAKPVDQAKRPRYAVAIIQALDKVSAETLRFEAPINQPIRYKSLIFIVRACETNAPDEPTREAAAHVEIISQPPGPDNAPPLPGKRVFRGWMFANAPGLDLFQHPVYDAWVIACKTAAPST